ncbi:MAG: DUF4147 domain-containing protein [Planctomyces sp.]|nr:DUF4147 domain-containing protein [Planctomyces sp.]
MTFPEPVRDLAIRIWSAGVRAVDAERLVRDRVSVNGGRLTICGESFELADIDRLCVVGAGKAGAGMAAGLEAALGPELVAKRLDGWVNVPANCVRDLRRIHLHAARPAGVNEPAPDGVAGAAEILRRVSMLGPRDVCLVLISGGGSALLPAPIEGVSLEDKLGVTRFLSAAGATIQELNAVRRAISRVKGGGLLRSCRAGTLIALIISDVIGDPLDVIASGPTSPGPVDSRAALDVLNRFDPEGRHAAVRRAIELQVAAPPAPTAPSPRVVNAVIGNNRVAVDASAEEARRLGLADVRVLAVDQPGVAAEIGRAFARECARVANSSQAGATVCLISGGEPVVALDPSRPPGKGGRNQELALAALCELRRDPLPAGVEFVVLSGGTDGEDGPTDAAGAFVDSRILERCAAAALDPEAALAGHDSYVFFESAGGLLITGPTHTNVMDLRVAVVRT